MDKKDRKRLRRAGREVVDEQSRRIAADLAARQAENTAPIHSDEWMRVELQRARAEAEQAQAVRDLPRSHLIPSTVLGDRAVQLARTHGEAWQEEARRALAGEFNHISDDPTAPEFVAAYQRALALLEEAEVVAAAVWDNRLGEEQAKAQLRERFPGHEMRIYEEAFAEGLSRTR